MPVNHRIKLKEIGKLDIYLDVARKENRNYEPKRRKVVVVVVLNYMFLYRKYSTFINLTVLPSTENL